MGPAGIVFFPFVRTLRIYRWGYFLKDFVASISVALLALPQAMAYAFVAGLPPQVGIFSAIFGTLFASAFGESRYLIAGPTTQAAILLQSGLSELLTRYYPELSGGARDVQAVNLLLQLVLLVGLFQVIAGLLRMGRLTQFTSRSVISGYGVGVACAIIVAQLYPFFGVAPPSGYVPLYLQGWYFLQQVTLSHWPTLILSLICLTVFLGTSHVPKRYPIPFLVFCLAGMVVYFFKLSPSEGFAITDVDFGEYTDKITLLGDIGPLFTDLPRFHFPMIELRLMGSLVPLAFAIGLLGVIQAAAIGRTFASVQDPPYNDNQEVYGLGVSNLACAFLGGMPSSGNFVRSALNKGVGGVSRCSGIFSSVLLFLLVFFLGDLVTKIPLAALSAFMILTAFQMLGLRDLMLCMRATRADAFVVVMTFVACLFFTFDTALYIGVAISVVLYLKQAAVPLVVEYTFTNIGKLRPIDLDDERPDNRIAIFQPEGELFFGAADLLQTKLQLAGEDENVKVIILQLLNIRHIDASVCLALKHLNHYLEKTGRRLMISGVSEGVYQILEDSGLAHAIGHDAIFPLNERLPGEATRAAYAQAKGLL